MAQFMDIFALYNAACADNNTQQSGHLRPQTNFQIWINIISTDLFNSYYKQAGKNQKIKDILDAGFLKTKNVTVLDVPGADYDMIPFPTDYAYFSSVRAFKNTSNNCGCIKEGIDIIDSSRGKAAVYNDPDMVAIREKFKGTTNGETKAMPIDNQDWGTALSHKLKIPNWNRVMITETSGGFKIVPKGIGILLLDYYRYPAKAVFAYTTNLDGTINYNLGASVQLDWPNQVEPEMLAAIKQRFASFTDQDNKYQQAVLEKKETK